ncbi:MAG TPA: hypothetical protein VMH40_09545 [Myxococcaceae bacterium]|nr:hypothetical protein [Myxococcaceae bacterium]
MRPCPVCEAPVTGWQCEVCGKQVGPSPGASTLTVPLEGLETTQLPADGLSLAIEPAPGLERTVTGPVPEVPGDPLLGWEATQALGAPDVLAGGLVDLDTGRAASEGPAAVAPTVATCRYCKNVQASGLFCDRCGMRLPWAVPAAASGEPVELRTCTQCGERSPVSMDRCGGCGATFRAEEP